MKRLFLTVLIFMFYMGFANAATLKWDASTGQVDGYNVYWGNVEGVYPNHSDTGNVTEVFNIVDSFNLHPNRTYYFVVRAYNASGESEDSNIANHMTAEYTTPPDVMEEKPSPPGDPTNLSIVE